MPFEQCCQSEPIQTWRPWENSTRPKDTRGQGKGRPELVQGRREANDPAFRQAAEGEAGRSIGAAVMRRGVWRVF